jgi:hypothetical protein
LSSVFALRSTSNGTKSRTGLSSYLEWMSRTRVDTVDRRNGGITTGKARDYLVNDRLFAQLDHPRSLRPVHLMVN